jgi:hypothetical protein
MQNSVVEIQICFLGFIHFAVITAIDGDRVTCRHRSNGLIICLIELSKLERR